MKIHPSCGINKLRKKSCATESCPNSVCFRWRNVPISTDMQPFHRLHRQKCCSPQPSQSFFRNLLSLRKIKEFSGQARRIHLSWKKVLPVRIPTQDYCFFCDEAGISNDRFVVVGGLCMHKDNISDVLQNMESFREHFNMTKELKWTKITNQKLKAYDSLVQYFFAMNNTNICQFHCVIFDNHT